MKNVYLCLILLFVKPSTSTLKCNPKDNCLCFPSSKDFEFQCPKNFEEVGEFLIHIKPEKEIQIDCIADVEKFNINNLPNITIHKTEKFVIRFCPLPENGFKQIFDHFSLKTVKFLQFGSFNLSGTKLTKEYFKGLEFLEALQLNANSLVDLEEDVFANTPNLTWLDLQLNRIQLKKDFFKYTPLLKMLDISENKLENIPLGLFQNLNKLELLHLWSNDLKEIDDSTFQGLINLKSLELSSNKIENISEGAFKSLTNLSRMNLSTNKLKILSDILNHNTKLEKIVIRNNPDLKISDYVFSNLPVLEDVDLSNCDIENLPENIFENSLEVKNLNLMKNKLKNLPDGVFRNLKNLEEVHLSNNKIDRIGGIFATLSKLKTLIIDNNEIRKIEIADFKHLINLEEINLKNNIISEIDNYAFSNNDNLKKIDISHNQYSGEYNSQLILLENVHSLESVDLSHNRIGQVGDVITLYNKVFLKFLDLSHNEITNISMKDLQPLAKKLTINLENNNITTVDFGQVDLITENIKDAFSSNDQPHSVIFLSGNPFDCDCYNYDLVRYFQYDLRPQIKVMFDIKTEDVKCANPPELKDMFLESLPQKLLICSFEKIDEKNSCPEDCSCSWRPFDTSLILDCADKNFTQFPQIDESQMVKVKFNQTEVHLEKNLLSFGLDRNLTGYENVTRLYLSANEISDVDWLPSKIEILHLDENKISRLGYRAVDMLNTSSLVNLTLDNNPWRCECEDGNFTNFLRQHTKVIDARNIFCFNSTSRLIDLNKSDLCQDFLVANIVLPIVTILLIIVLFLALYYRYTESIKIWLYAHNLCLWWVTEEELDKDKIYDAFISYSHKDEDFVVQNLLPVLEGGPNPYKLCIHFRDFVPGEFISTQVTNSVLESRRTLVVLSPNFLESVWGKMEFRTAHTQAMTEGRARVIIVLYGDVEMEKLDDELKSYLKTNTYVKWGDPYFWNKLKYALPHSKRNNSANNNQKIANVMRCIDDKFQLVAPVTPSPGTTPPVLNLDPESLKKHPLHFIASHELDTPPAESGILLKSTGL